VAGRSPADEAGRPLLVCGHPKTGTTLLLSLLEGHPDILAFPEETKYFRQIHGRPELGTAEALLSRTRISRLAGDRGTALEQGRDFSAVDRPIFEAELHERLAQTTEPRDLFPAVILAYARATGQAPRRYWVEKTPLHEHHLDEALDLWPDLMAVYLARDPRDTFASFRKKRASRGKPLRVGTFARRMRASLAAWDAFAERRPESCCCIRYEDLVREPRAETERIADFLGIEWHESLIRPTHVTQPWGGNSMYEEKHEDISVTPIGRYEEALTSAEVRAIEYRLAPLFQRFDWHRENRGGLAGRPADWMAVARTSL
jgi:LPS sulfotransferase NodH